MQNSYNPKATDRRHLCRIGHSDPGRVGRFLYLHYQMQQNGNPSYSSQAVDWDGSFKTEGKEGYITMPGYDTYPLQEGKDTSKIVLANPDTNQCLFQFQLIRSTQAMFGTLPIWSNPEKQS